MRFIMRLHHSIRDCPMGKMGWHISCIPMYNATMISLAQLEAGLPIRGLGNPVYFYHTIGSTNDVAAEFARKGSPHGTLVVADEQTAGRGRAGRTWYTPPDCAIALSLVLRPKTAHPPVLARLSALGAMAVAHAIEKVGAEAAIKWPNDVLLAGKKVGGVLAECSWSGSDLEYAVLGVGVNMHEESIPGERDIDFPATCLEDVVGMHVGRTEFLFAVLEGISEWYPKMEAQAFIEAWDRRLAYRGREVVVQAGQSEIVGKLAGISKDGRLNLITKTGETFEVTFGDMKIRPVDMSWK
jgi:BirA family biotin operon repressor/biotin-[acetyl-CoA-carboxylase] ligase